MRYVYHCDYSHSTNEGLLIFWNILCFQWKHTCAQFPTMWFHPSKSRWRIINNQAMIWGSQKIFAMNSRHLLYGEHPCQVSQMISQIHWICAGDTLLKIGKSFQVEIEERDSYPCNNHHLVGLKISLVFTGYLTPHFKVAPEHSHVFVLLIGRTWNL